MFRVFDADVVAQKRRENHCPEHTLYLELWDFVGWKLIRDWRENPVRERMFLLALVLTTIAQTWTIGFEPMNTGLWILTTGVTAFVLCVSALVCWLWHRENIPIAFTMTLPPIPAFDGLIDAVLVVFNRQLKIILHPSRLGRTKSHHLAVHIPNLCPRAPSI